MSAIKEKRLAPYATFSDDPMATLWLISTSMLSFCAADDSLATVAANGRSDANELQTFNYLDSFLAAEVGAETLDGHVDLSG
jgi:hypothetical protein